jgi:glucosamine-6-phosphate deaminase
MTRGCQNVNVTVHKSAEEIGETLAVEILNKIQVAQAEGRRFLLGCPGGRSLRSTYDALGRFSKRDDCDLSNLIIIMMDDYVFAAANRYEHCPADAHYSCRRFAREDIVRVINAGRDRAKCIREENIWFPDPNAPQEFDQRLRDAGGIDLFLLASGASDGHVAFNPPGSTAESRTRIVRLAETTRRDNLASFPDFPAIEDVPSFGVTVGLGTIAELSREVVLVLHGSSKATAAIRLLELSDFTTTWPASIVFRCRNARIMLDESAAQKGVTP